MEAESQAVEVGVTRRLLYFLPKSYTMKRWALDPRCANCDQCQRLAALGEIPDKDFFEDAVTGETFNMPPCSSQGVEGHFCYCAYHARGYDWTNPHTPS